MQLKKEPPELLNKGLNDHVALVAVALVTANHTTRLAICIIARVCKNG